MSLADGCVRGRYPRCVGLPSRLAVLAATPFVAVALLACGGDGGAGAPIATRTTTPVASPAGIVSSREFPPSSDPARNIPEDQRGVVNVVIAGADFSVGRNNFVFGITNRADEPQGGARARATFYDLRDPRNPKPVFQAEAVQSAPGVGEKVQHVHASGEVHIHGGQDDGRVGYYVPVEFGWAGPWGVAVEVILKDGTRGVSNVGFMVTEKPAVPAPGMAAIPSDNLTRFDVADIREIDSGDPPNDMHDVKIRDALAAGRPLVIVFSTPAYCTSRFCGPVTEEVELLHDAYRGRVDFVHIEIWQDVRKNIANPTAMEWLRRPDGGLVEPYVYVVGKDGIIYDRWEGPVARNIIEPAVQAVAAGQVWSGR